MTYNTFDPLADVESLCHRRLIISASRYALSVEIAKAMIAGTIFLGAKYSVGPYKTACTEDTGKFALIGYSDPDTERHSTTIFESAYTAAVEWISYEGFENATRIVNEKLQVA